MSTIFFQKTISEVYNTSESFDVFIFFLVLKKKEPHAVESFISWHNHCSIEIFILRALHIFAHVFSNFCSGKSQCQQFETWQVNNFKAHNSWRRRKSRQFS